MRNSLRSQQAARAWAGQSGERFAQLSAFFPESFNFNEERIYQLRSDLDRALVSASMESTPGRILYTDAWSASTDVIVTSERERNPVNVKAIAVGGDFFLFHPLFLRDGNYLSPDDLMKDRVILDEALAWRLFGAVKLAGFEIHINDKLFIIAGVISRENDFASSRAYTEEFGLFMSFDALMDMTDGRAEISTYELVMPDPITGFGYKTLSEALLDRRVQIVENSGRFSLSNTFSHIRSFGVHNINSSAIIFPYWENAARTVEDWLALLLVLSVVFIIFPVICTIIYTVIFIRYSARQGKGFVLKIIDEKDRRDYERYMVKQDEEAQIKKGKVIDYNNETAIYDVYGGDEIIDYDLYGEPEYDNEYSAFVNSEQSDDDKTDDKVNLFTK